MNVHSENVYRLIYQDFGGNLAAFGRALGLSYTTVWRTLTGRSSGSTKFIPALFVYCKRRNRDISPFLM